MTDPSRLSRYFQDYASFHRTPGNKVCHYMGIPTIVMSLLGLLSQLVIFPITADGLVRLDSAILLWAVALVWYVILDWRLSVPYGLATLGLYWVGRTIPVPALWAIFLGGWVVQYIGHYVFEKRSPAFYKNGIHLLVGPFWILAGLLKVKVGQKEAAKKSG